MVATSTDSSTRTSIRQTLIAAGVPTDLHVLAGAPHAFDMPDARHNVAQRAQRILKTGWPNTCTPAIAQTEIDTYRIASGRPRSESSPRQDVSRCITGLRTCSIVSWGFAGDREPRYW